MERAIADLTRSGVGTGIAQSQLLKIGQLVRQIGNADASTLVAMQTSVAGLIAETQSIMQQGREVASRAEVDEATFAAVNVRTRETVQRIAGDLFERRVFDPYLQFASAEDEEAYRKRESERQDYIRRELAKGTPEGNRNAANAAVDQIKDAGNYGADQSPDYQRLLAEASVARDEQEAAMAHAATPSASTGTVETEIAQTPPSELDEIAAIFKAAGVQSASPQLAVGKGHGLADATIERDGNQPVRQT